LLLLPSYSLSSHPIPSPSLSKSCGSLGSTLKFLGTPGSPQSRSSMSVGLNSPIFGFGQSDASGLALHRLISTQLPVVPYPLMIIINVDGIDAVDNIMDQSLEALRNKTNDDTKRDLL
jgi:hypothetical protein